MFDLADLVLGNRTNQDPDFVVDTNETFFVTGGAGSLGRELVFRLLRCGAKSIHVFDNSVSALVTLEESIMQDKDLNPSAVEFVVGDVRSPGDVSEALARSRPQVVFHFAALKYVDIAEENPCDAFDINVEGTLNVLKASRDADRFAMMSTDKAVFPHGMMGATKRFAEVLVMLAAGTNKSCAYSIIRSGNVVGSSGSALDEFVTQVKNSRVVTITHPDMKRFFIGKSELIGLVLASVLGLETRPGYASTYIIDCGSLVRIVDIAEKIAFALGKKLVEGSPKKNEIGMKYIGVRDGEKLQEEMHHSARVADTDISKVKRALDDDLTAPLQVLSDEFRFLCDHSKQRIEDCLLEFNHLIQSDYGV